MTNTQLQLDYFTKLLRSSFKIVFGFQMRVSSLGQGFKRKIGFQMRVSSKSGGFKALDRFSNKGQSFKLVFRAKVSSQG